MDRTDKVENRLQGQQPITRLVPMRDIDIASKKKEWRGGVDCASSVLFICFVKKKFLLSAVMDMFDPVIRTRNRKRECDNKIARTREQWPARPDLIVTLQFSWVMSRAEIP